MPQIINTNIASINAQRNLNKSQSANQSALQRLSSGLRINSAKDDAAGLAISTRFTSQIKGLNVAVRNAGDGIALAQTAEGALGTMNDNLQRIRELAVQSANATNSEVDRDALQAEVKQLVAEITRTAEETEFNGRKLLNGDFKAIFQVGANAGQTIDVSIAELTAHKLGGSSQSGLAAVGNANALGNGDLTLNGIPIKASKAEDDTLSVEKAASSAMAKVAAINRKTDDTGVKAQVADNVAAGSAMTGKSGSGSFTLNGVEINFSATNDAAQTRASIAQAINAVSEQLKIKAVDTKSDANGINLVATKGQNITLVVDESKLSGMDAQSFGEVTGLSNNQTFVSGTKDTAEVLASVTVNTDAKNASFDKQTTDLSGEGNAKFLKIDGTVYKFDKDYTSASNNFVADLQDKLGSNYSVTASGSTASVVRNDGENIDVKNAQGVGATAGTGGGLTTSGGFKEGTKISSGTTAVLKVKDNTDLSADGTDIRNFSTTGKQVALVVDGKELVINENNAKTGTETFADALAKLKKEVQKDLGDNYTVSATSSDLQITRKDGQAVQIDYVNAPATAGLGDVKLFNSKGTLVTANDSRVFLNEDITNTNFKGNNFVATIEGREVRLDDNYASGKGAESGKSVKDDLQSKLDGMFGGNVYTVKQDTYDKFYIEKANGGKIDLVVNQSGASDIRTYKAATEGVGVYSGTSVGGYTLVAQSGRNSIVVEGGNGTGRGDLANAGLVAGDYKRGEANTVTARVAADISASKIGGGDFNNTVARADSGATLIGNNNAKVNVAATAADVSQLATAAGHLAIGVEVAGKNVGFASTATVADSFAAKVATTMNANLNAAGVGDKVKFFEQIDFTIDVSKIAATAAGGGTLTIAGKAFTIDKTDSATYDADAFAASLTDKLNTTTITALGSGGSLVAEMSEDRSKINIRIKNNSDTQVTISTDATTTSITTDLGASGTTIAKTTNFTVGGALAYEALGDDAVEVTTSVSSVNSLLKQQPGGTVPSVTKPLSVSSSSVSNQALTTSGEVGVNLKIDGQSIAVPDMAAGSSVASIASKINGVDGVSAYEEINVSLSASTTDASKLKAGDKLSIGGIEFSLSGDASGKVTSKTLADSINGQDFSSKGIEVSAEVDGDKVALTIRNFNSQSVQIEVNDASGRGLRVGDDFVGEQAQTMSGELKFVSDSDKDVSLTLSDPANGSEIFSGKSQSSEFKGVNGLDDGDMVIEGVSIKGADQNSDTASARVASDGGRILSSEKGLSAIAVANSINAVKGETGVTATVNETKVVGGDGTGVDTSSFKAGDQAAIYINGVNAGVVTLQNNSSGQLDLDKARADAFNLINQNAGKTGVDAVDNGVSLTLSAKDGRNLSVAIDDRSGSKASIGALLGLDAAVKGIGESTFGKGRVAGAPVSAEGNTYETTFGTIKLNSAKQFEIKGGQNGSAELEALGLKTGTYGGGEDGQFLKDIDISTFEGAQRALTAIDNAIGAVASQRADLGAIQNRMQSTVNNLQVTSENLSAANSRIQDADFAAETAELSRTQVLQQAGISILAQANASGQQVLSLLG